MVGPAVPPKSALPLRHPLPSTDPVSAQDASRVIDGKAKGRLLKGSQGSPGSPVSHKAQGHHQHALRLSQDQQGSLGPKSDIHYPSPQSPGAAYSRDAHHRSPVHPARLPAASLHTVYPSHPSSTSPRLGHLATAHSQSHSDPQRPSDPQPDTSTQPPARVTCPTPLEASLGLSHKLLLAFKAKPTLTRTWEKKTFTDELQSAPLQPINHPNGDMR